MITRKKGKEIILGLEPIAQGLLSVSDELGEHDIVSISISNTHISFFVKTRASSKGKHISGMVWNKTPFSKRGEFDYSEG